MSCGCGSSPYADYGYNGLCRQDLPYPQVSHESVPSLIDNLVTALYGGFYDPATGANSGGIIKSVVNGRIVWTTPCNPSTPPTIANVPPNPGEGLLCYLLRVFQQYNPSAYINLTSVQTLTNKTLVAPTITGGASVSGTVDFTQATIVGGNYTSITVNAANNLAFGSTGQIPYQVSAGNTGFLTLGAAGSLLQSNGTLPTWIGSATAGTANTIALRDSLGGLTASAFTGPLTGNVSGNLFGNANTATTATTATSATLSGGLSGGTGGAVPYQSAASTTAMLSPGTAGYVLSTNGPGNPPSWIQNTAVTASANNLTGGATGSVPYQSSGGTTAMLAAGTAGYILQTNGTSGAPTWLNPTSLTAGTATNIAGGAAGSLVYQTGVGATASVPAGTAGQLLKSNGTSAPSWVSAASANTASAIVQRDSLGSFSAGTVTAALFNGNATSANSATSASTATTANSVTGAVIAPANLTAGGPSWDTSGNVVATGANPFIYATPSSADGAGGFIGNGTNSLSSVVSTIQLYASSTSAVINQVYNLPLLFLTNNTQRMAISAAGNVGIGTNSPSAKLEVNGNAKFNGVEIGSAITTGVYGDGVNLALRAPSTGGAIYLQSPSGTSSYLVASQAGVDVLNKPIFNSPTTAKAWVNFDGNTNGTFAGGASTASRPAGSHIATVTTTNPHGLLDGQNVSVLTGVAVGVYGISYITATSFSIYTTATTAITNAAITFAVSSIRGQYNVSSVSKFSPGSYTINFAVPLPNANYAVSGHADSPGTKLAVYGTGTGASTFSTARVDINVAPNGGGVANADADLVCVTVFGTP